MNGRPARAQAHTLEAVVAALVLLSGVVFALQATAVTPLSASTSSQSIENQQHELASGLLEYTAESGALRRALLSWGDEDGDGTRGFHCAPNGQVFVAAANASECNLSPTDPQSELTPPNGFGAALNRTFGPGVAINVDLTYRTVGGGTEELSMVVDGQPTDDAVTASTIVTILDDDQLYESDGSRSGVDVSSGATGFYADNLPGVVYNVVRVEVTVWRR